MDSDFLHRSGQRQRRRRSASRNGSSESPSATGTESITIVEDSNANVRGKAASLAGSRPSCVRGPVQGGEVGGRNHCSGENDPLREELQRVRFRSSLYGPEACGGHGQIGESTRGGCESARNTPTRGSTSSRWRGTSCCFARGVSQSTTVPGPSSDSGAFCNELATLRDQELHRERDELKAELCAVGGREESRSKKTRTLAIPAQRLDDAPQFVDSAQCNAVKFVGVSDQSGGFRQGQCISSRVLMGRLLWKCRRLSVRYGHRLNHPNLSSHALLGFSYSLPRHNTGSEKTKTFVITLSSPIKNKYFHE